MNRNPGRPKVMLPCDCASRYMECNCEWLRQKASLRVSRLAYICGIPPRLMRDMADYVYIPLMVLAVSMVIVGLRYLFGG